VRTHHAQVAGRLSPELPQLAGFEPRFDRIPLVPAAQPPAVVRPLYWWAQDLHRRGCWLRCVHFSPAAAAALVSVRLPSYRVVEVLRRHSDVRREPTDLPTLLAEALYRLGVTGWGGEIADVVDLLRESAIMASPNPAVSCTRPIPWLAGSQPDRPVRVAYWWAHTLLARGWRLHACGEPVAAGGFIAEIPAGDDGPLLAVYPHGMRDDGTEASALANYLARLSPGQREFVQRLIADTAAKVVVRLRQ